MKSRIVGQLNSVEYDADFYVSKPYPIPYFDNKKLKIGYIEAKYEPYLIEADNVLQNFLYLKDQERVEDSQLIFDYYIEIVKHGYTQPLPIKQITDIWNFVFPSEIIIHWDENTDFYLCVSCQCGWEEEHGLQLVFKEGKKLTRAGGHDGAFIGE